MKNTKLITLTGPSCSGKTTLLNSLVENHGFKSVVSHTSRPMRPGEIYGKDYYFVSQDIFDLMNKNKMFIETISFNGYSYGVGLEEIEAAHRSGKTAVLIVEPTGLMQVLKYAEEKKNIEITSVYIGGTIGELMTRYIARMAGEDLAAEGVAKRHSKRIQSMVNERIQWQPLDVDLGDEVNLDNMRTETIPYKLKLSELGPENFDDTITKIKELNK